MTLRNRSARFADLDRIDEAAGAMEEASSIYRRLPPRFVPWSKLPSDGAPVTVTVMGPLCPPDRSVSARLMGSPATPAGGAFAFVDPEMLLDNRRVVCKDMVRKHADKRRCGGRNAVYFDCPIDSDDREIMR